MMVCSKCNTENKDGAEKCVMCGFLFSGNKMSTVGKYLGEFSEKPTMIESNYLDDHMRTQDNVEMQHPLQMVMEPVEIISAEDTHPENNKKSIPQKRKSSPKSKIDVNKSNKKAEKGNSSKNETESLGQIATDAENDNDKHNQKCTKCGYILSDFSNLCPNCGHNNVKINVTMKISETVQLPEDRRDFSPTIQSPSNPLMITGIHKDNHKEKNNLKTIVEDNPNRFQSKEIYQYSNTNLDFRNDVPSGINRTMSESIDFQNNEQTSNFENPLIDFKTEIKSPVRLEAIYLGQDSDQKMIINFNLSAEKMVIHRSMVDEGDSTISSNAHAIISKIGDEWSLENVASNKAVFLQVNESCKIKDGDIIMLGGDKFYIFIDEFKK